MKAEYSVSTAVDTDTGEIVLLAQVLTPGWWFAEESIDGVTLMFEELAGRTDIGIELTSDGRRVAFYGWDSEEDAEQHADLLGFLQMYTA